MRIIHRHFYRAIFCLCIFYTNNMSSNFVESSNLTTALATFMIVPISNNRQLVQMISNSRLEWHMLAG